MYQYIICAKMNKIRIIGIYSPISYMLMYFHIFNVNSTKTQYLLTCREKVLCWGFRDDTWSLDGGVIIVGGIEPGPNDIANDGVKDNANAFEVVQSFSRTISEPDTDSWIFSSLEPVFFEVVSNMPGACWGCFICACFIKSSWVVSLSRNWTNVSYEYESFYDSYNQIDIILKFYTD